MKIDWTHPAVFLATISLVATLVIAVVVPVMVVICAWTYHLADMMMP